MKQSVPPPKFNVGEELFHISKKKYGKVTLRFVSDYRDGAFFEYKYYVQHSGWAWIVPELALRRPKINQISP